MELILERLASKRNSDLEISLEEKRVGSSSAYPGESEDCPDCCAGVGEEIRSRPDCEMEWNQVATGRLVSQNSESSPHPIQSSWGGGRRKRCNWSWSSSLAICLIAAITVLSMSPFVSGEMLAEDDFDSSNKKVKFEDFDTNVTPGPVAGGGGALGTSSTNDAHKDTREIASLGFIHAFIASFSVIVVSELGDKTFFIAAIMAMRHSRITVFAGAISALAIMTVLSALFGYATTIIPRAITYYVSTFLFAVFGLKMLYDGYRMSPDEGAEELEEVQATLRRRDDDNNDIESQTSKEQPVNQGYRLPAAMRRILFSIFSRVFLQALTMTFIAEWGDRSQIATIILAAREDVPGVCIGGVLGHSFCTGLAVLGGRMIAQKISVRTVTIIGGVVFLIFAITSVFINPEDWEDVNDEMFVSGSVTESVDQGVAMNVTSSLPAIRIAW